MRIELLLAAAFAGGLLIGGSWLALQRMGTPRDQAQPDPVKASTARGPRENEPVKGAAAVLPAWGPQTLQELAQGSDEELREESAALLQVLAEEAADGG